MKSILTEPSLLSYDLCLEKEPHSIKNFAIFTKTLIAFTNFLETENIKIAMTRDLYSEISGKIPSEIYQNDSPYSIARELFSRKIPKVVKYIHKYGDHNTTVIFDNLIIQNHDLLETESYILWKDLIGIIKEGKLQKEFIRSESNSAFKEEDVRTYFNDENGSHEQIYLKNLKKDEILEKSKTLWLIKYMKEMKKVVETTPNVECTSTGDHGNMWNHGSITTINNVPPLERTILKKLIDLKNIKEIKFLNFDVIRAPVDKAFLEIKNVEDNYMICLLRGKGNQQNCQNIKILFHKNFSKILGNIFETDITEEKIEKLITLTVK